MKKQIEIIIPPEELYNKDFYKNAAAQKLGKNTVEINAVIPIRRSIDARSSNPIFKILSDVFINESPDLRPANVIYSPVNSTKQIIIIGCGPAGMFAALKVIELGIKPVIFERGKDVQSRRRDLRAIQQFHQVNPNSNYCFGEGGAGTYSDGKLYTRSSKRGNVKKILQVLVQHGAHDDILIDAHPHIGSNKLPDVVKRMRETIINNGGEVNFNSLVTDFIIKNDKIAGIIINDEKEYLGDAVILATGHSARDIYYLLHRKNIPIEPKPFAIGVRIEHPQALINEIQYHTKYKNENLPPASYSMTCEIDKRGVYSFCMCPGGIIVPAATAPEEIVVNGMSLSKRDSPFANSGFVVTVNENDWKNYNSEFPFSGLKLQIEIEKKCFELANKTLSAPSQRITDFIDRKISQNLPATSYIPGLTSTALHEELPKFITSSLRRALFVFNKKMKGYITNESQIVATESRTSSPIRVPRNPETLMHSKIEGLFPSGEGAGYAGGIVSAAIDGENCAEACAKYLSVDK